jgi:hypothetical protein
VHIHGSLQGRSLNRNVGEAHQFSSSKSTFASKAFIRFNNYRANEFSRSGRWEKAKYIHASSPGFDQDPKNDSRPEPSLIQNPSDKEEKRNGKPSAQVVNEDNRPTRGELVAKSKMDLEFYSELERETCCAGSRGWSVTSAIERCDFAHEIATPRGSFPWRILYIEV